MDVLKKFSLIILPIFFFGLSAFLRDAHAEAEDITFFYLGNNCKNDEAIAESKLCELYWGDCCANRYYSGPLGLKAVLEFRPISGRIWRKKGASVIIPRCGGSNSVGFGSCPTGNRTKQFKLSFRNRGANYYRVRMELLGDESELRYDDILTEYGYTQYFPIFTERSGIKSCFPNFRDTPDPFVGQFLCSLN